MSKNLTVAQVLSWRPETLTELAGDWKRQGDALRTELDEQYRAVDGSRETWKGAAGEAMRTRFDTVRAQAGLVLAALDSGHTTALLSASNYQVAKSLVAQAKTTAESSPKNFVVKPDGTCEISEITKQALYSALNGDADRYGTAIAALSSDANTCTAVLKRALANAADVDTTATQAIKKAFETLPDDTSFGNSVPVVKAEVPDPPAGGTPEENRKYWETLTPEQQQTALQTMPAAIGSLDGLPADVRDTANRTYLASEKDRLTREVDQLTGYVNSNPKAVGASQELVDKRKRLQDLTALEQSISDKNPDGKPKTFQLGDGSQAVAPRKLLMLDTTSGDQVRAAVAVGDPDTADHISVTVPGLTSNVRDSIPGMVGEADALQSQAQAQLGAAGSPDAKVSTIAWMGYDPPQKDLTYPEVGLEARAQEAAQPLSNFYQGLETANRNTDPHITALGHSYGSLATSLALQENGGAVDDVVFYGSPGLGRDIPLSGHPVVNATGINDAVESAADLGLQPGHVYEMTERDEFVGGLNAFGRSPALMPWVTHLSTEQVTIGDTTYTGASGHSEYGRTDGTTHQLHRSGYNLAAIVAGLPENAINPGGGK